MTTVAVVHDYLTQKGGAERVVLSMMRAFPQAVLHTSLYSPDRTYPEFAAFHPRTLPLDKVSVLRRNHRWALPLLGPSFARHTVDADVVLCSSSGWAHAVRTSGRKLVYCYAPARWLFQSELYVGGRPLAGAAVRILRRSLVAQDRMAAATANRYLTLSTAVQARIRDAYGIDAEVVPPPMTIDTGGPRRPIAPIPPGFHLCVSRLLPYKHVDAVVDAFAALPQERLVVAGTGPERRRLEAHAGANVTFVGTVHDDQLRWLYHSCTAVIAAGDEDYGLTPLEAAAFGKPAAVLRSGGFLDTMVEEETGVFFDRPTAVEVADAVRALNRRTWSSPALESHAARYGQEQFVGRLREIVQEMAAEV